MSEELSLIYKAKAGDTLALDTIFANYKQFVTSISRKYYLVCGDLEDLVIEGMMGLYKAILSYDETKNDNFKAYAYTIILREILGAIRHDNTNNNKMFSDMMFLDDEDGIQFTGDELNPEDDFLQNEKVKEMLQSIKSRLSGFENKVFELYLAGFNYHDIAQKLDKTDKSIDNALNRIKNKLQYLKGE